MSNAIPKPVTVPRVRHRGLGPWSFIWRGALGATIGSLVSLVVYMYQDSYARLFLLAFLMSLWIPAAYGLFVGVVLWLLQRKYKRGLNMIVRAIVGIGLVSTTCLPFAYFSRQRFVAAIGGNIVTTVIWDSIIAGLIIGLPAAIFAPSGKTNGRPKIEMPEEVVDEAN